jgi:hypothetical protein
VRKKKYGNFLFGKNDITIPDAQKATGTDLIFRIFMAERISVCIYIPARAYTNTGFQFRNFTAGGVIIGF